MPGWGRYKELELVASAARTATGNSGVVATSGSNEFGNDLVLYLDVTAASGTSPTLDIEVFGVVNAVKYSLGSFAQKTAAGQERLVITNAPKDVQLDWTIGGGTPSFTFNVQSHRNADA